MSSLAHSQCVSAVDRDMHHCTGARPSDGTSVAGKLSLGTPADLTQGTFVYKDRWVSAYKIMFLIGSWGYLAGLGLGPSDLRTVGP